MPAEKLTVTDQRTGKEYEFAVEHGTISASELRQIKLSEDDFGLMSYDPAFKNTDRLYEAMGIPRAMFPVMFAVARTVGWCAQWDEMLQDSEQKIARPRQVYTGAGQRDYQPVDQRS